MQQRRDTERCGTAAMRLSFVARARGLAAAMLLALGGCAPGVGAGYRTLHEVDGEVVSSRPPPPAAYEAYLRARLALDREPPQLAEAQRQIERAIRFDPRDPQLWATRAEIEEQAGQPEQAAASARRALAIQPGYPLAEQVLSRVQGGAASASAASASAESEPPQP